MIVKILNHADEAEARLPIQYREKPKLTALVRISGSRAQVFEDILYDMLSNGSVTSAHASLLDQIGDVVGVKRNGLTDSEYKGYLLAKIAENVSKGTAETMIALYKALMRAARVYYRPVYPASFSLTAIGSQPIGSTPAVPFSFSDDPDPDGEGFGDYNNGDIGGDFASANGFSAAAIAVIKAALNSSRIAGVSIDYFASVDPVSFSFSDDPDPSGMGFGDSGDDSIGGSLAEII